MAWSTSELAKLAGTTVNTVRHYHRLGLLEEPVRRYNGYKQYDVAHLVRLLRIRRLVELGVPLAQIGTVGETPKDAAAALRDIDAELEAGIERLQNARANIAAILREGAPADGPAGFEHVSARLSETDNSVIHLLGQVFDAEKLTDVRKMVEADTDSASMDLDKLLDDADEQSRQILAERMVPGLVQDFSDYPWLLEPFAGKPKADRRDLQVLTDSMPGLYNSAQLDVVMRAVMAAAQQVRPVPVEPATGHDDAASSDD